MTLPEALSCTMLYFCTSVIKLWILLQRKKQSKYPERNTQPPGSVSHWVTHLLQAFMNEVTYVVDTPS